LVLPNTKDMTRSTQMGLTKNRIYVRKKRSNVNGLQYMTIQCHLHFFIVPDSIILGLHRIDKYVALLAR